MNKFITSGILLSTLTIPNIVPAAGNESGIRLGGRIMHDLALHDEDKNPLGNGTTLRRARLEVDGSLQKDWYFSFSTEITGDDNDTHDVILRDALIRYNGFQSFKITTGQYKLPFGFEQQISTKHTTFMERGLINVFAPGRLIGLAAKTVGKTWTGAVGTAGQPVDSDVPDEGDEGWGLITRWTFAPFYSETQALHLGVAALHRHTNDKGVVRFSTRPESYVTDVKYLDTGPINNVENFNRYGFEAATVFGPFSLQGEYMLLDFDREDQSPGDSPDIKIGGWYVYASWFITGESRPYNQKAGNFGGIKPKRKSGAWEVAVRYSTLDLNDGDITGGEEKNITVGINWYINPQVRLMANYVIVDNDEFANANGLVHANGTVVKGDDDPRIFQTRVQLEF